MVLALISQTGMGDLFLKIARMGFSLVVVDVVGQWIWREGNRMVAGSPRTVGSGATRVGRHGRMDPPLSYVRSAQRDRQAVRQPRRRIVLRYFVRRPDPIPSPYLCPSIGTRPRRARTGWKPRSIYICSTTRRAHDWAARTHACDRSMDGRAN